MIKKLEEFFDTSEYWEIYFAIFLISTSFFILFTKFVMVATHHGGPIPLTLCIELAMLVTAVATISIYYERRSHKFFSMANELETMIGQTYDADSLLDIYLDQYQELKAVALGRTHKKEVKRLYLVIKTKFNNLQINELVC